MKENKKYTANDFVRYHSGAMPVDEMHALEKAAMEDPFLADALEGYAYSKNSENELTEISMRLSEKRKRNNVFSLYSLSSGAWWKIAAMVIIIAGAGYFFFFLNFQENRTIAVKENEAKKEETAIISKLKTDTSSSEGNTAFEKTSKEKNKSNAVQLPAATTKSTGELSLKKAKQEEMRKREEKDLVEKKLANEKENAVAMNSDRAVQSNITQKDPGEKSFYRSSDTTALVAVSPTVYDSNADKTMAMNRRNHALQEVVVTGYDTKRKPGITKKLEGKVSGVAVNTGILYPTKGKENFEQYIKDNATSVLDSAGRKIEANILLSFTVDKKGKPAHIKVLKSSCGSCEKEAIRLLKEGPRWTGAPGAKGTVTIQF